MLSTTFSKKISSSSVNSLPTKRRSSMSYVESINLKPVSHVSNPTVHHVATVDRAKHKLIFLEAQRIITVLDDTIQSLELISRFHSINTFSPDIKYVLGTEFIEEFSKLQQLYESLAVVESDEALTANTTGPNLKIVSHKTTDSEKKKKQLSVKIREQLRKTLNLLTKNRPAVHVILSEGLPSNSVFELIINLQQLRKYTYERLSTREKEEYDRYEADVAAVERKHIYQAEIDRLTNEIDKVRKGADSQLVELQSKIQQLEDDIEKMVTISSEAILQKRMDTLKDIHAEEQTNFYEKLAAEDEFNKLNKAYCNQLGIHCESENNLRKRNFKLNTEVENWIQKYDEDMTRKLAYFESITDEYEREKLELQRLEMEFGPVEENYLSLIEDKKSQEAIKLELAQQLQAQTAAVTLIQKYVRGWLARRLFVRMKSKPRKSKR